MENFIESSKFYIGVLIGVPYYRDKIIDAFKKAMHIYAVCMNMLNSF